MALVDDGDPLTAEWRRLEEAVLNGDKDPCIATPVEGAVLPIVIAAPHAVNHWRGDQEKLADRGTGSLALLLAAQSNCWAVVQTATQGDPSWDDQHSFKAAMNQVIQECRERTECSPLIIDLHGMASTPERPDIDFGLGRHPSDAVRRLTQQISDQAPSPHGLSVTVGHTFRAEGRNTITNWAQDLGLDAFQVEISARVRIPAAGETQAAALVAFLSTVIELGTCHLSGLSVEGITPSEWISQHPTIFLRDDVLGGIALPLLASAESESGRQATVWLDRHRPQSETSAVVTRPPVLATRRTLRELGLDEVSPQDRVLIKIGAPFPIRVLQAFIDDMPSGLSVQASKSLWNSIGTRRGLRKWTIASHDGRAFCLRLRSTPRGAIENEVRTSLLIRYVLGVKPGEVVQFSKPTRGKGASERVRVSSRVFSRPRRWPTWVGQVLGVITFTFRLLDRALEGLLRLLYRAPTVALRSSHGDPSDDEGHRVRIPSDLFAILGVNHGEQIEVSWFGRSVIAVALPIEDHAGRTGLENHLAPGVKLYDLRSGDGTAFVSAPVRWQLGVTGNSAVELRRRVRPQVAKRLNQLVLPLMAVLLSAFVIPEFRGWPLLIGVGAVSILALSNVRMPSTPKGLWP